MRKTRKIISIFLTVALITSMIVGNVTFVYAQNWVESVEIEDLEELYHKYKDEERGTYSHWSWNNFQDALELAYDTLYETEEITDEMLEWAYEYLAIAQSWLEEHDGMEPDRTDLENAYHEYKDVEQGSYNQVSWKYFADALEEAYKLLYEYEYVQQNDLDLAVLILEQAYADLEEGEPDFAEIEEVYNQYKNIEQGDYNLGSWSFFKQSLNLVEHLLTNTYERESATQKHIDYMLEDLLTTYERLETGEPDLTELETLFEQFAAEYGDIDPNEFLTDPDDIELFDMIMYHVPLYLYEYSEEATHYETEELVESIKALQEKLGKNEDDEKPTDEPPINGEGPSPKDQDDKNDKDNNKDKDDKNGENDKDDKGGKDDSKKSSNQNNEEQNSDTDRNVSIKQKDDNKPGNNTNVSKENLAETKSNNLRGSLQEEIQKNILPNTSTENYHMIVLGLLILVEGIVLYFYFHFLSIVRKRFNLF